MDVRDAGTVGVLRRIENVDSYPGLTSGSCGLKIAFEDRMDRYIFNLKIS